MFSATPLEGYVGCGEAVRDMGPSRNPGAHQSADACDHRQARSATVPEAGEFVRNHIAAQHSSHSTLRISPISNRPMNYQSGLGFS